MIQIRRKLKEISKISKQCCGAEAEMIMLLRFRLQIVPCKSNLNCNAAHQGLHGKVVSSLKTFNSLISKIKFVNFEIDDFFMFVMKY